MREASLAARPAARDPRRSATRDPRRPATCDRRRSATCDRRRPAARDRRRAEGPRPRSREPLELAVVGFALFQEGVLPFFALLRHVEKQRRVAGELLEPGLTVAVG